MLGPALTQILQQLKKVSLERRTVQQAALLRELELLNAAMSPDDSNIRLAIGMAVPLEPHVGFGHAITGARSRNFENLTVTEPERGSTRICPICGADVP